MTRFFLPESTLEAWISDELADLREGQLHLLKEKKSLEALPAVHFLKLVSGQDDAQLLSKVKTRHQLEPLSAEVMGDSALVGETAYEIVSGYIAEMPEKPAQDTDLLAAFLLNKMG